MSVVNTVHVSPYLTLAEAAQYTRRAAKTLLNHHSLGKLRAVTGGRGTPLLFRREDLDAWIEGKKPSRATKKLAV